MSSPIRLLRPFLDGKSAFRDDSSRALTGEWERDLDLNCPFSTGPQAALGLRGRRNHFAASNVSAGACWQSEAFSHLRQFDQRLGLHLSHRVATMLFHCDFANTETTADLLVQEAHNHQRHHIAFARGEVA